MPLKICKFRYGRFEVTLYTRAQTTAWPLVKAPSEQFRAVQSDTTPLEFKLHHPKFVKSKDTKDNVV
jgi:hypothetical protein